MLRHIESWAAQPGEWVGTGMPARPMGMLSGLRPTSFGSNMVLYDNSSL